MKVLDLFSGLGGWSQAFKIRGHEVVTVDIESKFNPTICKDILDVTVADFAEYLPFDVVLASPPCTCFSMMSVYVHWENGKPKEKAKHGIKILKKTLKLINELNPKFWVVENPMGMMRTLPFMKKLHHRLITQCQYGRNVMKPTDLWGKFPMSFEAKRCYNGDECHERTPRGSHDTGLQALKTPEERAKLPYGLSKEFCLACENPTQIRSLLSVSPKVRNE